MREFQGGPSSMTVRNQIDPYGTVTLKVLTHWRLGDAIYFARIIRFFKKHIEVNASVHISEFAKMRLSSPFVFSLWGRIFHTFAGDCYASDQSKCMLTVTSHQNIQPFIWRRRSSFHLCRSTRVYMTSPTGISKTQV